MSGDVFDKRADVVNSTLLGAGFLRAQQGQPLVWRWGMLLEAFRTGLRSWRYNPKFDDVVESLMSFKTMS